MSQVVEYETSTPSLRQRLQRVVAVAWPWVRRTRYLVLPAILIAFLIQGYRLVPGHRGQMNPDGVSYLTIARQVLQGHYADSVNAYWSPLYSWLLVPLMAVGVEPLTATKVLAVLIGAGTLASVWWLLRNLAVPVESRVIVSLALFPILYYFGMDVTTPDLLMTAALLLYAAQMTSPRWGRRWWDGVLAGVLGGVAYLAKAYALPVVAGHLIIVSVVRLWSLRGRRRRREGVQVVAAVAAFAIVVGAWSAVLTHKYGFFTTGSTGKFNVAFNGPKWEQPMHRGFLLAPPNETGTSSWDDATVMDYTHWDPLATPEDRQFWEKNREKNETTTIRLLQKFTWLLWPIAIAAIRLAGSRLDPKPRRPGFVFVTMLAIYPLGYWLLHVYERFISLMCIGLLVLGAFAVARLTWPLWRWARVPLRVMVVMVVAWSFLSKPGWRSDRHEWPMALGRWSIADRWGEEMAYYERAQKLAGVVPARAKCASNTDWSGTLYVAYLLDLRYYGDTAVRSGETSVREQLAKHGIEFFWVLGQPRYRFLKDLPEISGGRVDDLRIYDLRPKPATTMPATRPN